MFRRTKLAFIFHENRKLLEVVLCSLSDSLGEKRDCCENGRGKRRSIAPDYEISPLITQLLYVPFPPNLSFKDNLDPSTKCDLFYRVGDY